MQIYISVLLLIIGQSCLIRDTSYGLLFLFVYHRNFHLRIRLFAAVDVTSTPTRTSIVGCCTYFLLLFPLDLPPFLFCILHQLFIVFIRDVFSQNSYEYTSRLPQTVSIYPPHTTFVQNLLGFMHYLNSHCMAYIINYCFY